MHTALTAALENGELFALYQPQLSADGARIAAAEALLRWERPGYGTVAPDDFVPFAEDNAFIDPLGTFILERACRTAAGWGDVPVSINVSPSQFARPDMASFILAIAAEAGLPFQRLEIEITEHAAFADIDEAARTLAQLRARGVKIALDDLGAGHATIALMRSLPLDRVKLGKPMAELWDKPEGAQDLQGLIAQARSLGLGVTAEGVETEEQLAFLRGCGCDRIQGFVFARPMTGAELVSFARQLRS